MPRTSGAAVGKVSPGFAEDFQDFRDLARDASIEHNRMSSTDLKWRSRLLSPRADVGASFSLPGRSHRMATQ
jgi:hypothetical protein